MQRPWLSGKRIFVYTDEGDPMKHCLGRQKSPGELADLQRQPHQITGAVYSSVLKSEQTSQEASLT